MTETKSKYIEAVGRRKTAIARVRGVISNKNSFEINDGKKVEDYFKTEKQRITATEAITKVTGLTEFFSITVKIVGGGMASQAEAMRHGIARMIIKQNPELRKEVKKLGFLVRDQRAKERRKFGLKKARKAAQWSKR